MATNETPAQRRERMLDILIDHNVSDINDPSTLNAMIAVEDAARADMFTEEQVRLAINYARTTRDTTYTEIINQINTPTP